MAGRIPPQFIDELLSRIDIVDVINRRVPLKRAGKEYTACCPFHDEKTPSFTVSQPKQFYHCFGCGAHGSAIGFLMEYDNLGFVEAVEELAEQAGIEVQREGGSAPGPDNRPLYQLLDDASRFYQQQLRSHPDANRAIAYLKQRGLSGGISAAYAIGYAPPGWDNLLRHFSSQPRQLALLRDAGLISEPDGKRYDRFRNRIIFPIRDPRGRVIGFGGRILEGNAAEDRQEKRPPKYLNSPETELFHKRRALYGLYEARQALKRIDRLLVVEGYMDVVALAQFGIRYAVATLGTATTEEHLKLIFRTCPEVIFCFDGDRAGREAAWKALQTALPQMEEGREIRFLFLPDGEDPDSLVRKIGADGFTRLIDAALPLSDFLFQQIFSDRQDLSIDEKNRLAKQARPLLESLPAGLYREMMFERLDRQLGLLAGSTHQRVARPRRSRPPVRTPEQQTSPIRTAITLLLDNPGLAARVEPDDWQWLEWQRPGIPLLRRLLEITRAQPTLNKAALLERWRGEETFPILEKLAASQLDLPDPASEFKDALQRLRQLYYKEHRAAPRRLRPSELSAEEKDELRRRFPGRHGGNNGGDPD